MPFWIKRDPETKKAFFDYCKKKKIQVIKEVRDRKMHAWTTDDYYNVSVRYKDTAKFNLETDKEFSNFIDDRKVLFVRLTISGKYDRHIELYELYCGGEFKCITDRKYEVTYMTMLDLGWIVNQTCLCGVEDLYTPPPKEEQTQS